MSTGGAAERVTLVVEDCELQRRAVARYLEGKVGRVLAVASFHEAMVAARSSSVSHALVDVDLPDGDGLDLLSILKRERPATIVVVVTGYPSIASSVQAMRCGADDYLSKPISLEQLAAALEGSAVAGGQRGNRETRTGPSHAGATDASRLRPAPLSLDRVVWEHIQRVLAESDGNVSEAARRLGIHRQSLQRKLRKRPSLREMTDA